MATQSLYRRYRPRRFSEVKGQEHIVRALRNAVVNHREGQAYLFSGPRGTGKTSSARILAKVLNCTNPVDGEPCCECESCIAVEKGTSYDVHELDAASNNGVDAMRDLIEKASLGTPGRHKVYILDEVHMLSKGAEAALLKTLEEPPPHVVFVLATTDPQKVSPTIRSRVQHLEFHLLPMDELDRHIRWVAADAGLTVSEDAFQAILAQGGGSARDTLSALELVAASGGEAPNVVSYDEFIESFIAHDPGRALAALAHAVQQGRDPRTLAGDIVRYLRECFLSLMAPELVQLSDNQAAHVADQAQRLGAAAIVRAMERLGEMLVEMRHAPDPRLLLDVALVQLTHEAAGSDVNALLARLERLEKNVTALGSGEAVAAARPAPVDPSTGRAALGGRVQRDASPSTNASVQAHPSASPPAPAPAPRPTSVPQQPTASEPGAPTSATTAQQVGISWQANILPSLKKPMARALYSAGHFVGERDGTLVFGLPNDKHRQRCEEFRPDVEAAIAQHVGAPVKLTLIVDTSSPHEDTLAPVVQLRGGNTSSAATGSSVAVGPAPAAEAEDDDIDIDDLVDAPPGTVKTPEDRLADAFPGSVFVEE